MSPERCQDARPKIVWHEFMDHAGERRAVARAITHPKEHRSIRVSARETLGLSVTSRAWLETSTLYRRGTMFWLVKINQLAKFNSTRRCNSTGRQKLGRTSTHRTSTHRPVRTLIEKRARTDCFGACGPSSSASLRTAAATRRRPSRRSAGLSNRLVVCREFELKLSSGFGRSAVLNSVARPERFELPTTWFEARKDRKIGNSDVWKSLIFNNHARGMSVANSSKSTTKHH